MPPTKGGARQPPKGGKGSGKGKGQGTRAPLAGGATVTTGKGAVSAHSGTATRKSSKKGGSAAATSKRAKRIAAKKKRNKKPKWARWALYVHKLQSAERKVSMSRRAMSIVGAFVEDMFERLATSAANVCKIAKLKTLTAKEVQTAARLVLPQDFASHSISEGTRAVNRFNSAKEQQKAEKEARLAGE